MNQTWHIIYGLPFYNVEYHLKLLNLLSEQGDHLFFREDEISLDILDDETKQEIVNENFEIFIYHLFVDETNIFYSKTEQDILLILNDESIKIEERDFQINFHKSLKILLEELSLELQNKIKQCVTKNLEHALIKEKKSYIFSKKSFSYRYYSSNGLLDNAELYNWFEVMNIEELNKVLREKTLYDAIITNNRVEFNNYSFYINFFEAEEMILAIHDNKNKLSHLELNQIIHELGENLKLETKIID